MTAKYFKTREAAQKVLETLPPFEPSNCLHPREIESGMGKARILEFKKGFTIQLGYYGNYYPETQNNTFDSGIKLL